MIHFAHAGRSIAARWLALFLAAFLAACSTSETLEIAPPQAAPTKYAALVVDTRTGKALYSVAASEPRIPASLTKMMTLYMLFEAIESGRLTVDSSIPVSAYAARRPPTKLYFKAGESVDVDTAIRALVVKSANDVASAVAEYIGGTEDNFATMMTAKARSLGMTATVFRNASGLPANGQITTARDMAVLGMALKRRFPQHYHYFSDRDFTFRGRVIRGHNRALDMIPGADGIKTGYVRASGFNLVTSVNRDGRSVVAVVMGGDSGRARDEHMRQLVAASFSRASRR